MRPCSRQDPCAECLGPRGLEEVIQAVSSHSGVCVCALYVHAPLANCDVPMEPRQEPRCETGTTFVGRLARHNFRFKSTGTEPGVLRPAVVGARYSGSGGPRPILSQAIPVGRDPPARRDCSVPTMEGKKPSRPRESVSLFQFGPEQAGKLFRLVHSFRSPALLVPCISYIHFHARPGPSY